MKKTPKPKPPTRAFLVERAAQLERDLFARNRQLAKAMDDAEKAEKELAALKQQLNDGKLWTKDNPRWTQQAKSTLALAEKEATAQGDTFVGTDHILLGLLKQGEGFARRVFVAAGLEHGKVEFALRVGRCS